MYFYRYETIFVEKRKEFFSITCFHLTHNAEYRIQIGVTELLSNWLRQKDLSFINKNLKKNHTGWCFMKSVLDDIPCKPYCPIVIVIPISFLWCDRFHKRKWPFLEKNKSLWKKNGMFLRNTPNSTEFFLSYK